MPHRATDLLSLPIGAIKRGWIMGFFLAAALFAVGAACAPAQVCPGRWIPDTGVRGGSGSVSAITALPNGDIIIGGLFDQVDGVNANNIARLNALTGQWQPLGDGVNLQVRALAGLPNNDIVVGGFFTRAGGVDVNFIARWNSAAGTWSTLGAGTDYAVIALDRFADGQLAVGGYFRSAGGLAVNGLARVNPTTGAWSSLSYPGQYFAAFDIASNGELLVADDSGVSHRVYRRAASGAWTTLPASPSAGFITSLAALSNSNIIIGFNDVIFTTTRDVSLALWSQASGSWSFGNSASIMSTSGPVYALALRPAGDVLVGGIFTSTNGVPADNISRWAPSTNTWPGAASSLAGFLRVHALHALSSGDAIASGVAPGEFGDAINRISRWNSAANTWTVLGSTTSGKINALAVLDTGEVIAGGNFTRAGAVPVRNIAKWSPLTGAWSSIGSGIPGGGAALDGAKAILTLPGGDLIVGGQASSNGVPGYVVRWSQASQTWFSLGSGLNAFQVNALALLPDGDVVAGGFFNFFPVPGPSVAARWDAESNTWSNFSTGLASVGELKALVVSALGELMACGDRTTPFRFDSTSGAWMPLGTGTRPFGGYAIAELSNGSLLTGGQFSQIIHRLDRATNLWSSIGATAPQPATWISALLPLPNSDFIAAGFFSSISGVPASSIARHSESTNTWSPLSSGIRGQASALARLPNGDIVVGGIFSAAGGLPAGSFARWSTRPPCPADYDCNGAANLQDIFSFLALWFSRDPRADFNGLTGVTVQDIFDFLSAYFTGCA